MLTAREYCTVIIFRGHGTVNILSTPVPQCHPQQKWAVRLSLTLIEDVRPQGRDERALCWQVRVHKVLKVIACVEPAAAIANQ